MNFEDDVTKLLLKAGIKEPKLSAPPNPEFGDLSFACFELAKERGSNPVELAKEISSNIKPAGLVSKIIAIGPYVNFYIDMEKFSAYLMTEAQKKDFGGKFLRGKTLIEHTSINPNAPPHVGRSRNAIISDSIVRILRFAGQKVDVHYFVNDIGKQIAMLVYATRELKGKPNFEEMLNHYIEINRRVLENAPLERKILDLLYKLENGDREIKNLFEDVVSTCVKGQTRIFNALGIKYDSFDYESKYIGSKLLKSILRKLKTKTKKDSDGRLVLDLSEFNLPMKEPFVPLTRNDGTSLYFLRDIAYNVDKIRWSKGGKNIVVLGEDHKLEFMQIKAALSFMKLPAPEAIHYTFILLPEGKMSTRSGTIVLLTEFMEESVEKARVEIMKRHPHLVGKELNELAKIIGYGALKYSILKISAEKNVTFRWEEALNFEGMSAPYIQYSFVRAKRILEKAGKYKLKKLKFTQQEELDLIKEISKLPDVLRECAKNYQVHSLAKYAYDLALRFNLFYEKCRVADEPDPEIRSSRLALSNAYKNVIKNVLFLLGIDAPTFM